MRIAINGFGRIGRQFFKVAFEAPDIEIVAINDLGDIKNLAYLLTYDTVYGKYEHAVSTDDGTLVVAGKKIRYVSEPDPLKLPWKDLDIDVVVESTGRFASYDKAKVHLDAGAKRIVITAPAHDDGATVTSTPNVNVASLKDSFITSNASCTTNATIPVAAIMGENPGIEYALLSTVHGYTATQSLVDGPGGKEDFRRGRAAAQNIVPSSTGVAEAAAQVIPELGGRFDGLSLRVPVVSGSIIDFTFIAKRPTTAEEINNIFREAALKDEWKEIIEVSDQPLVSSDILKNPHGAIIDLALTRVVGGKLVKVMAWYDNEWGYVNMLLRHVRSLQSLL